MRSSVFAILLLSLPAIAEEPEPPRFTKDSYPGALVERPLILPDRMLQPIGRWLDIDDSTNPAGAQSFVTAGADFGIADIVQVGLTVTTLVSPDVDFGSVRGNLQAQASEVLSGRLDVGLQNLFPPAIVVTGTRPDQWAFVGGAGFVLKYPLSRHFALTSGSPSPFRNDDDMLTWQVQSSRSYGLFGFPIGLLVQFHRAVALEVRSGFRLTIGSVARQTFVPIGGELTITPRRRFDIVVSAQLPGDVDDYTQVVTVQGWLQARF